MQQQEEELSVDDILSSIRHMLTQELENGSLLSPSTPALTDDETNDIIPSTSAVEAMFLAESKQLAQQPTDATPQKSEKNVYHLNHPIASDVFILTPDMRVDKENATHILTTRANETLAGLGSKLSPETEKRIRILLDEWLTQNLPQMIEHYLKNKKKK